MKNPITTNRMATARCIAPMLAYRCMGGNASLMFAPRRKSLRDMQAGERGSVLRCSP